MNEGDAESTVKTYPTWAEWLLSVGGGKQRSFEIRGYAGSTEIYDNETVVVALNDPIPAEFAKKLGAIHQAPQEGA